MTEAAPATSTPSFLDFDPRPIPFQYQAIDDIFHEYDYSRGFHEVLYSGALGSSKTLTLAHVVVRHCIENDGARALIARKAMPDLKRTLFQKIEEHLQGSFIEGRDYWVTRSNASIRFRNGSEIISTSWSDRDYYKVRSLDLSLGAIEEITENDVEDKVAYKEIGNRIGRLPHVKMNALISATNPEDQSHWAYDHFELVKDEALDVPLSPLGLGPNQDRSANKHVYYSVTADNPFLPPEYDERNRREMDPLEYQRMGRGRWVDLRKVGIYHAYQRKNNFRDVGYTLAPVPIILTWDFNIAEGKPLSAAVCQFYGDQMHIFGEAVIEGMRTEQSVDEIVAKGWLDYGLPVIVTGDASGRHKDTRSNISDYDIILKKLANYRDPKGRQLRVTLAVPLANPEVRKRHNTVNAYCCNDFKMHRLFVYRTAPTVDKGLRLTRLKKSASYVEDDSKKHPYQHITTAIGYALMQQLAGRDVKPQRTVAL